MNDNTYTTEPLQLRNVSVANSERASTSRSAKAVTGRKKATHPVLQDPVNVASEGAAGAGATLPPGLGILMEQAGVGWMGRGGGVAFMKKEGMVRAG